MSRSHVRLGLFVEGAPPSDLTGSRRLTELWLALLRRVTQTPAIPDGRVNVFGFSKGQITVRSPDYPPDAIRSSADPIDVLIQRMVQRESLSHVVIAFDARPSNQFLGEACMRAEVNVVLQALADQVELADTFRNAARDLLGWYAQTSKPSPRGIGHPPRNAVDVIFMRPEFESMFVHDDSALRQAFGVSRKPRDWPSMRGPKAKDALQKALDSLPADVWKPLPAKAGGGKFLSNPHGWGRLIVEQAPDRMFLHEIPARLRQIVLDLIV